MQISCQEHFVHFDWSDMTRVADGTSRIWVEGKAELCCASSHGRQRNAPSLWLWIPSQREQGKLVWFCMISLAHDRKVMLPLSNWPFGWCCCNLTGRNNTSYLVLSLVWLWYRAVMRQAGGFPNTLHEQRKFFLNHITWWWGCSTDRDVVDSDKLVVGFGFVF